MNPKRLKFYHEMFVSVSTKYPHKQERLAAFAGLRGQKFGGLMFVGRATNGWGEGHPAKDLAEVSSTVCGELFERKITECPMQWVDDAWGAHSSYNAKKSAFWRVVREITVRTTKDRETWFSQIGWSNLYKIAPAAGNNPSERLADIVFPLCAPILADEIDAWSPKTIIFLTGLNWANRFLAHLDFKTSPAPDLPMEALGTIRKNIRVIVFPHPQGKSESPIVNSACHYINGSTI